MTMPLIPAKNGRSSGTQSMLILACSLLIGMGAWAQTPVALDEPAEPAEPPLETVEREPGPSVEAVAPERTSVDDPAPSATRPDPVPHDPDFRYETSNLSFPTPPELFRSLSKAGSTRWRQLYRPPLPELGTDRHRAAIGLGTNFADLYLAAEAGDAQHLRNAGQDVIALGRGLGVGEYLTPVLHELGGMAEQGRWNDVRERLQSSLNALNDRLRSQRDDDLVILIDLGMWLRVLEISSQIVVEDEDFQPLDLCIGAVLILDELRTRHAELSKAARKNEAIDEIGTELMRLGWRWDGRSDTEPSHEDVEASYIKIRNLLRRLLQRA